MELLNQLFKAIERLNKASLEKILSAEELNEFRKIQTDLQDAQNAIDSRLDKINLLKPMEDFNFEFSQTNSSLYNVDLIVEELAGVYLEYTKCIRSLVKIDDLICKLWLKYSGHLPIQEKQADA